MSQQQRFLEAYTPYPWSSTCGVCGQPATPITISTPVLTHGHKQWLVGTGVQCADCVHWWLKQVPGAYIGQWPNNLPPLRARIAWLMRSRKPVVYDSNTMMWDMALGRPLPKRVLASRPLIRQDQLADE